MDVGYSLATSGIVITFYNQVAAFNEAKSRETKLRDQAFKGGLHDIVGIKIRPMAQCDLVLLTDINDPFVHGREPNLGQLAVFLWVLSPQFEKWRDKTGWRRFFLLFQPVAAWLHARRCRRLWDVKRLEKLARLNARNNWPFQLPSECKVALAYDAVNEYLRLMTLDAPEPVKGTSEAQISALAHYTGELLSERICQTEDQVMHVPLPKLFQWLKYLRLKRNPSSSDGSQESKRLRFRIVAGLNAKHFNHEDLKSGRINLN